MVLIFFCLSLPSMLFANAFLQRAASNEKEFSKGQSSSKQKKLSASLFSIVQPFLKGTISGDDAADTKRLSREKIPEDAEFLEKTPQEKISPKGTLPPFKPQEGIFHQKIPHNRIPNNPLPRNAVPKNPLERNAIPSNPLPRNAIPNNKLERNRIPKNPIPKNPIPRNPLPQNKIPSQSSEMSPNSR